MKVCANSDGGISVKNAKCSVKVNGVTVPCVLFVDTDKRMVECISVNDKINKKILSIIERFSDGHAKESISPVTEAYKYKICIKKAYKLKVIFKEMGE